MISPRLCICSKHIVNPTCIQSSVLQYLQKGMAFCNLTKTSVEDVSSYKRA
jgi:hypothetical protein